MLREGSFVIGRCMCLEFLWDWSIVLGWGCHEACWRDVWDWMERGGADGGRGRGSRAGSFIDMVEHAMDGGGSFMSVQGDAAWDGGMLCVLMREKWSGYT
jgi:hypothetical protein